MRFVQLGVNEGRRLFVGSTPLLWLKYKLLGFWTFFYGVVTASYPMLKSLGI